MILRNPQTTNATVRRDPRQDYTMPLPAAWRTTMLLLRTPRLNYPSDEALGRKCYNLNGFFGTTYISFRKSISAAVALTAQIVLITYVGVCDSKIHSVEVQ